MSGLLDFRLVKLFSLAKHSQYIATLSKVFLLGKQN